MIDIGDGAYCFIDQDDPTIKISSVYYNRYTIFTNDSSQTCTENWGSGTFISPADYNDRDNILFANAVNLVGQFQNRLLRISNIPYAPNSEFIQITSDVTTAFSSLLVSKYLIEK